MSSNSAAKPMPPAERISGGLFETRVRQASGTEPGRTVAASPVGGCRRGAEVDGRTQAPSEHVRRRGTAQNADSEQRRNQGHGAGTGKHAEEAHLAHSHRQQRFPPDNPSEPLPRPPPPPEPPHYPHPL